MLIRLHLLRVYNRMLTIPAFIANCFNNFCDSIESTIPAKIPPFAANRSDYLNTPKTASLFILPTDTHAIISITKSLKPDSSPGDI